MPRHLFLVALGLSLIGQGNAFARGEAVEREVGFKSRELVRNAFTEPTLRKAINEVLESKDRDVQARVRAAVGGTGRDAQQRYDAFVKSMRQAEEAANRGDQAALERLTGKITGQFYGFLNAGKLLSADQNGTLTGKIVDATSGTGHSDLMRKMRLNLQNLQEVNRIRNAAIAADPAIAAGFDTRVENLMAKNGGILTQDALRELKVDERVYNYFATQNVNAPVATTSTRRGSLIKGKNTQFNSAKSSLADRRTVKQTTDLRLLGHNKLAPLARALDISRISDGGTAAKFAEVLTSQTEANKQMAGGLNVMVKKVMSGMDDAVVAEARKHSSLASDYLLGSGAKRLADGEDMAELKLALKAKLIEQFGEKKGNELFADLKTDDAIVAEAAKHQELAHDFLTDLKPGRNMGELEKALKAELVSQLGEEKGTSALEAILDKGFEEGVERLEALISERLTDQQIVELFGTEGCAPFSSKMRSALLGALAKDPKHAAIAATLTGIASGAIPLKKAIGDAAPHAAAALESH